MQKLTPTEIAAFAVSVLLATVIHYRLVYMGDTATWLTAFLNLTISTFVATIVAYRLPKHGLTLFSATFLFVQLCGYVPAILSSKSSSWIGGLVLTFTAELLTALSGTVAVLLMRWISAHRSPSGSRRKREPRGAHDRNVHDL